MFEKEAEEWAMNLWCKGEYLNESPKSGYQKGAEFGYNKAKEEIQEIGLALQSDMDKTIEQNIALKKQIEKMRNCSNCNGIVMGGLRTDKCKRCIRYKDFPEWEIKEND